MFSMYQLYVFYLSHVVELELNPNSKDFSYEKVLIQIIDVIDKVLCHAIVKSIKVLWSNHSIEEAIWELEEEMRDRQSHLFSNLGM